MRYDTVTTNVAELIEPYKANRILHLAQILAAPCSPQSLQSLHHSAGPGLGLMGFQGRLIG